MSQTTRLRLFILCALLVAAAALVLAPTFSRAASAPAWATFQGDAQHSGDSSASGPTKLTGAVANTFSLPPGIQSTPVIDANGVAYIGDNDGNLYALSPSSPSAPLWSFKTGGAIRTSPALSPDGSVVYVGSDDGGLYAINTSTHQQLWKSGMGGPPAGAPVVGSDGTIYIAVQTTVESIKASNGSVNWTYNQGTAFIGSIAMSLDGSTLYAAAQDGLVYGIPVSGPSQTGGVTGFYLDGPPTSSPSVDANNNIYVATVDGNLFSFAPSNTTPRWTYAIFNHQITNSAMALSGQNGIIGAATGAVYAVNLQSGTQVWQYQTGGPIQASAAVTTGNGHIYIGSTDGYFYELDSGGKLLDKLYTGNSITASPGVAPDGSVWIASESGTVYRIHDIGAPGSPPPQPSGTIPPAATNTPVPATTTGTVVPTNTPTAVPTSSSSAVPLTVALKASVKDGQKQTITITSAPNTSVKIRIDYPNGDHQSASRTTDASGKVTYTYTQGASKTTHSHFEARVTVKAGSGATQNTVTKTYKIGWGKLDVSAEPRKVAVGKTVDIFVHAAPGTRIIAILLAPNNKQFTKRGTTGRKGLASIKFKVPRGLTTGSNKKVIVLAKFVSKSSSTSTKTTFTIG